MLDLEIIKQQVEKSYPKIRDYYSPDIEGWPKIDYDWPNVYARYSGDPEMEGEDPASAEFVRKDNKIYIYLSHIPDTEQLVRALIHEYIHFLQSESWMKRYYKSGGYKYHNHPYEVKAKEEEKKWKLFI